MSDIRDALGSTKNFKVFCKRCREALPIISAIIDVSKVQQMFVWIFTLYPKNVLYHACVNVRIIALGTT